jgi:hypothetical protein
MCSVACGRINCDRARVEPVPAPPVDAAALDAARMPLPVAFAAGPAPPLRLAATASLALDPVRGAPSRTLARQPALATQRERERERESNVWSVINSIVARRVGYVRSPTPAAPRSDTTLCVPHEAQRLGLGQVGQKARPPVRPVRTSVRKAHSVPRSLRHLAATSASPARPDAAQRGPSNGRGVPAHRPATRLPAAPRFDPRLRTIM